MATLLLKPITRQLATSMRIGRSELYRPTIMTVHPGDVISFREKGRRTSYDVSLHDCAKLAMMIYLSRKYKEDLEEYNRKKKAGYKRIRRPRQPNLSAFHRILRLAIS